MRQRGSRADAGAIKATGECDECGQSVKPPLKSQYYLQDILWCLQGLDKDKMERGGLGGVGGAGLERRKRGKGGGVEGSMLLLAALCPPPKKTTTTSISPTLSPSCIL